LATGLFLFPADLPGLEFRRNADMALRGGTSRASGIRTIQQFEL
jgi:hypothetical protein